MKKGLVIGKFYPPHKGHSYLIETALQNAEEVTVLVCDHPSHTISAEQRAKWLAKLHPEAIIRTIPDIGKDDDSQAWADHTLQFLGYAPDIVFSSEDYGDPYAKFMGSKHHLVDRERTRVPISARHIRPDVLAKWEFLDPIVRANYAVRIAVVGAESTGTTTLARELAAYYKTPWVPEYGRIYSEAKLTQGDTEWTTDEFTFIAGQQQALEDKLAGISNGLLICDTDTFATRLWHERYMGYMSEYLDKLGEHCKIDFYILTAPDIPFVQDGTRDGEHIRHTMHDRFIEELTIQKSPYIIVHGNPEERLRNSVKQIDTILSRKVAI